MFYLVSDIEGVSYNLLRLELLIILSYPDYVIYIYIYIYRGHYAMIESWLEGVGVQVYEDLA